VSKKDDRAATLEAARILYGGLYASSVHRPVKDSNLNEQIEEMLVRELKKAQDNLNGYRAAKAAFLALDALLPGWFEIDASDHLPKDKWHAFVSNDKGEWVDWLVSNGIERAKAKEIVKQYCEDRE